MQAMLENLNNHELCENIEVLPLAHEAQEKALPILRDAAHRHGLHKH